MFMDLESNLREQYLTQEEISLLQQIHKRTPQ
jgi:hypothetical protein